MEEYVDSEDEGKYIVFSIKYLNNKYNKNEFTIEEVIRTINSTFDLKYNKQKIYKIGITERMLEDGIVFEDSKGVFKYNDQKTRSDIAKTKVIKYELKKVSKKSKNKFVLTYNKYVVDNPYKVLNFYYDKIDTNKINVTSSYLKGERNITSIKSVINKDNIKEFGKIEKSRKVILKIVNKKLLIEKIK